MTGENGKYGQNLSNLAHRIKIDQEKRNTNYLNMTLNEWT